MLRHLIMKRIDAAERQLGESMEYARHMTRVSLRAVMKFSRIMPLVEYRRVLPKDAFYISRLIVVRDEDCGSCVRIELNLAKKDRIPLEHLRAVLEDRPEDLPEPLADTYHFATAVVTRNGEDEEYRERIRRHYGEEGMIEMSLAIASCRIFPVVKRAMGYAKGCSAVKITV